MKRLYLICCLVLAFALAANAQTVERLYVQGAKGKLAAIIQKPATDGREKLPTVVVCHGFTGSKDEALLCLIADSLQRRGIASIRFDFNGHGQSEGKLEEMTVPNELEDALRVVAYCRSLPWVGGVDHCFTGDGIAKRCAGLVAGFIARH